MAKSTALSVLNPIRKAIESAQSYDDLMELRSRFEQQAKEALRESKEAALRGLVADQEFQHMRANAATYGKILAERRVGAELAKTPKAKGGRPRKTGDKMSPVSLAALGIHRKSSERWQLMASVPQRELDAWVKDIFDKNGQLTSYGLLTIAKRKAKNQEREVKRQENQIIIDAAPTIEEALEEAKFQTIVIDPPWDWGDEGDVDQLGRARPTYQTLSLEELTEYPVEKYAESECHLYLWITNRSLPKGFGLIEAWGFRYVTCLTWCKPSIGMGNYFRGSTEHALFGIKGSQPLKRQDVGTWIDAPRDRKHSGKPNRFYEMVESCSYGPYLDIFARRERKGWTCYGPELT